MIDDSLSGREAFGRALVELGAANSNVVVVSADLDDSVKVGAFGGAYPDRFFQVGIAEQNMVSIAAGLATTGLIPFAASFANIIVTRSIDQINISCAYSNTNVKIVGAYLGVLSGKTGATHQAISDIALMRALPRMVVLSPGDAREVAGAVAAAAAYQGPVYMRIERERVPVFPRHQEPFEIGKGIVQREGDDIALVGTGLGVAWALEAAEILAGRCISARVIDIHTIKPLDQELILKTARETRGIVTIEHHSVIGGLGSAVCEAVAAAAPVRVERVGLLDVYAESGSDADLLKKYHLTPQDVVAAAERVLQPVPA